jgi:hypothetical protein
VVSGILVVVDSVVEGVVVDFVVVDSVFEEELVVVEGEVVVVGQ